MGRNTDWQMYWQSYRQVNKYNHTERQINIQRDRETAVQTDKQTEQTDRHADSHADRKEDRQIERHRQAGREESRYRKHLKFFKTSRSNKITISNEEFWMGKLWCYDILPNVNLPNDNRQKISVEKSLRWLSWRKLTIFKSFGKYLFFGGRFRD
jgi:hypothetical protein